ncbi:MAG: L-2-hydroxyglutarate oxidase [Planctomycetes bacterium]|nr:L-2-hydroxyglutarate oxidase [Planctomycetota bacterium]
MQADLVVIGGGIVGLATGWQAQRRRLGLGVTVLEKEPALGQHQTGRNSGVIHTGVYYRPGSLKAKNCTEGRTALIEFCREHRIAHEICGKVIVAVDDRERPRLHDLHERAQANGVPCDRIGPERLAEIEPSASGVEALWVPGAGIVDYAAVVRTLAEAITSAGGEIRTSTKVIGLQEEAGRVVVRTDRGELTADRVVNCAGVHSDRVAKLAGARPPARIVPFRGEYFALVEGAPRLCRNLIYPVPDPAFPFLGVHFTRRIDGTVDAGPNAVLAFGREGYAKLQIDLRDLASTLTYPGFLRLALRYWRTGAGEMWRSVHKGAFVRALRRLVPALQPEHLAPAPSGIRAQAIRPDGGLVDDFLIEQSPRILHVCNAPSPAATASLKIGETLAQRLWEPAPGRAGP